MMCKITNRSKQAIASKNKIFNCGVNLIRQHGFDSVTIEQIAKEAGVSVGTYYYYFTSKMDLLKEIFYRADQYFQNEVDGKLKATNCKDQIIEFFDKYVSYNLSDGIDMIKKLYTSENKLFISEGRYMQKVLFNIIKTGKTNQEIKSDTSSNDLSKYLFTVARGVVFDWCLHDGKSDLKKDMHFIINLLIKNL